MPPRARVLLAGADARVRLHLRRLLTAFPGIDVAGHVRPGASVEEAAGHAAADVILVDTVDDPAAAAEALAGARRAGLRTVVLTGATPAPDGAGPLQLRRPTALEIEPPRSPFGVALAAALRGPGGAGATQSGGAGAAQPAVAAVACTTTLRAAGVVVLERPRALVVPEIIAIGCSTGGPQALPEVLCRLNGRVPQPIVVTQHMPASFTTMLAEHLGRRTGLPTVEAQDGMPLQPGRIHIAPGGHHLLLAREGGGVVCRLDGGPPENFCRPSVDPMLRAVVRMYGGRALAVILTGMGQDGLIGCRAVVEAGGAVLAQDEATSVVWGMPGAVAQAGICHAVLPLDRIGDGIAAVAQGISGQGVLRHAAGTRRTS